MESGKIGGRTRGLDFGAARRKKGGAFVELWRGPVMVGLRLVSGVDRFSLAFRIPGALDKLVCPDSSRRARARARFFDSPDYDSSSTSTTITANL